jgi:hypothetical protein
VDHPVADSLDLVSISEVAERPRPAVPLGNVEAAGDRPIAREHAHLEAGRTRVHHKYPHQAGQVQFRISGRSSPNSST